MVYTITFNPALDYIVEIDDLKQGQINKVKSELLLPGGKGINVSIVLNNLGIANKAITFVAGFTGDELLKILKEMKIDTEYVKVQEGLTRINVKIANEQETAINGNGPKITNVDLQKLYEKIDLIEKGDFLVLSGSIGKDLPLSTYEDICERIKDKNINIVVDARKELLTNILKYKPFLIKPNKEELQEIFGVELKNNQEIIKYAKELKKMGAINVLISMGDEGAILVDENEIEHHVKAQANEIINTVGAGDSTVAGFLMRIYKYKRL